MSATPVIVVAPQALTDAVLVSTNVPETDHAEWAAGTTYAAAARVIVAAQHSIYESATAGNIGNPPATSAAWVRVGPTNRWAAFDGSHSSVTARATAISYTLRPGQAVTCVAALSLVGATSMRVRVVDPVFGTVYDRTLDLSALMSAPEWWEWYFGARSAPAVAVLRDLPSFPTADILIDLAGGANLAVGVLMFGQTRSVGLGVLQGARLGIQDYSRKETDDFGNVVVVQRAYAKRADWTVPVLSAEVDSTFEYLATLRTQPCLWIGSSRYGSAVIFGFYKDFDMLINYGGIAECSLQIQGLT